MVMALTTEQMDEISALLQGCDGEFEKLAWVLVGWVDRIDGQARANTETYDRNRELEKEVERLERENGGFLDALAAMSAERDQVKEERDKALGEVYRLRQDMAAMTQWKNDESQRRAFAEYDVLGAFRMERGRRVPSGNCLLGLNDRARNVLRRAGIKCCREVAEMSDGELLALRGVGETTVSEVRKCLAVKEKQDEKATGDAAGNGAFLPLDERV
jgi:hypothetical protein